jgi:hypothetical protein
VCCQGETAAAHDVTSNIERSKHLDNDQQAKIYKAEVRVATIGRGLLHLHSFQAAAIVVIAI